jgi:TIR domain
MAGERKRRTYREIFLDALTKLSNGEQKLISNTALKQELDWGEEGYDQIKRELKNEKKIIVGQGRGGTVALAKAPGVKGLSLFISYSHNDEGVKNELAKHLKPLERIGLISEWHDRKLKAGEEWDKAISENLRKADVILLLISVDFINSKYCFDVELEEALKMHAAKKTRVIPVVVRNCLWSPMPFAKLQALPKDGKAVASWSDIDEALTSVADGVRLAAEELMETR